MIFAVFLIKRPLPGFLACWCCLALLLSSGACTHYQPAGSTALPFKTLYIEPVKNRAYVPQAQVLLTDNIIKAFLRDGSVRIVAREQADATLSVTITDYQRGLSATQQNDTARARSFNINLQTTIKLVDNRTGKVYLKDRSLSADEKTFSRDQEGNTLPQAEYQTIPLLTRELARTIRNTVLNQW